LHGFGDGFQPLRRRPRRHGAATGDLRQVPALDEIHREIVSSLVLTELVDGHDVGVLKLGRRLGFRAEALHLRLAG